MQMIFLNNHSRKTFKTQHIQFSTYAIVIPYIIVISITKTFYKKKYQMVKSNYLQLKLKEK